jgi:hypothetical protein
MMTQTFRCPSCGAPLEINGTETTLHCEYCGETVVVPPELRSAPVPAVAAAPGETTSPHGAMSSAQMREMMLSIRSGQLEDAARAFQAGTGATPDVANQTVQMIANQIDASKRIMPAELASIMMQFAQAANREERPYQAATHPAPRRRQSGLGCWVPLLIILLVAYFAYTSLSPLTLAASLFAGNKNDPVIMTAVAPFHQVETAVAPALQKALTPAPTSANPAHMIIASHGAAHGQGQVMAPTPLPGRVK